MGKRVIIDCRDFPNEIDCTLLISGNAKEAFNIALRHSIEEHGHKDTPELRKLLRAMMKPESIKKLKLRSQTTKRKELQNDLSKRYISFKIRQGKRR